MNLLAAIARQEGFDDPLSRPGRNHNPGDIEWHDGPDGFASLHGADGLETIPEDVHETPRFAHFPDDATGFAAMKALLQTPGYKGKTVEQALNRWAPPVENNVNAYLANVCAWVGCKPTDCIDGLLG